MRSSRTDSPDLLLANSYFMAYDRKNEVIEGPYAPLGPLYIASCLREAGFQPGLFDGTHAPGLDAFVHALESQRPPVVGIYATVVSRHIALRMAAAAKRRGIAVVAGGPDPSAAPEAYLKDGSVDVVCRGEGEVTAVNLVRHYLEDTPSDLHDIRGLSFRANGEVVHTEDQPYVEDLDEVPFPARDLMDWEAYRATTRRYHGVSQLTVMTARGCPFQCTWCCKPIFGARYRHRSAKNVVREMLELKKHYQPGMIRFADDILTINRRKFLALADEIEAQDAQIPFECLTRVDLVDDEILERLKDIGCLRILYGVETGSQRVLDAMKKGTKVEQVHRISRLTRAKGIEQYWFLIYGYPPEDIHDLRLTVDMVRRLEPDDFGVTIAYPLPQTEFYGTVQHSLREGEHWRKTRDNQLLYEHKYSTPFYKTAIYGTRLVHWTKRLSRERPGLGTRVLDGTAYRILDTVLGGWARIADG